MKIADLLKDEKLSFPFTNQFKSYVNELEKHLVIEAWKASNFNKSKAARLLRVHRYTFIAKLKKLKKSDYAEYVRIFCEKDLREK